MNYAYVIVSTKEQSETRQIKSLEKIQHIQVVFRENIWCDYG